MAEVQISYRALGIMSIIVFWNANCLLRHRLLVTTTFQHTVYRREIDHIDSHTNSRNNKTETGICVPGKQREENGLAKLDDVRYLRIQ